MSTQVASPRVETVRFEGYEVDLLAGRLYKEGVRVHLREQSFQVLAALLEQPGQVITREELRHRLWDDAVFVDFENNLNAIVARLRQALCDTAEHPQFIETLPKRGYRFIGAMSARAEASNGGLSGTAPGSPAPTIDSTPASVAALDENSAGGVWRRRAAALIQLLYTAVWMWFYRFILQMFASVERHFPARLHTDNSMFVSGALVCVITGAELLMAALMFRRATSPNLLIRLFPVYCALNVVAALLAIDLIPPSLAFVLPLGLVLAIGGPFYQRRLLRSSSRGAS